MGADEAARPVLAIRLGPALRSCDAAAALRFAEAVRRPTRKRALAPPMIQFLKSWYQHANLLANMLLWGCGFTAVYSIHNIFICWCRWWRRWRRRWAAG